VTDQEYMAKALALANQAYLSGEVPIGCIMTRNDQIIAEAYNQPISRNDPTAHAEILALRQAGEHLHNYRLIDTTLYVTLEPCAMCVGAMIHARIKRLVFAASDPKTGMVLSCGALLNAKGINHSIIWEKGVLENESSALLKKFFKEKR
jgi:tRNA(adenine34) deaminase